MSSQTVLIGSDAGNGPASIQSELMRGSGFRLWLVSDPPGLVEVPAMHSTLVSIHIGPPALISCRRGRYNHRGTAVHGDIDIVPGGTPSVWEMKDNDTVLAMGVPPAMLRMAAEDLDLEPERVEIRNRFQVRDAQLENIAWVLKDEMESGYPCGRLYIQSLAQSVAVRLVACHSSRSLQPRRENGRLSDRRLRQVLSYIESNLDQAISLRDIAGVAGLSVSHFKGLFRQSVGVPVHQYLIRRRVERATSLLRKSQLSISQIALETGFAHQSHLARHMRRLLGVSPRALREAG
jgi:AraC family transcriptional regulator